jgi:multiple sugar transport system permease protein
MGKKNLRNGILFISPWILGFILFTAYPLGSSLYYSLTQYNSIDKPKFIGLDNYHELLFNDPLFYKVLSNTLYMIFVGITIVTIFTIFIAILLNNKKIKGISLFRVIFYLPTLVPLVVLSMVWFWILQPDAGLLNSLLRLIGIHGPGWFTSPDWSKPSFIMIAIWSSGGSIIIYLAGLQDIPESLYEAASLDGASAFKKVLHITLPMLQPVILFNVTTGIIRTFQQFAEAFIITNGGPNGSSMFYALYLYQNAFQFYKLGYASSMAWILLIICLVFMLIFFKAAKKWGYSE